MRTICELEAAGIDFEGPGRFAGVPGYVASAVIEGDADCTLYDARTDRSVDVYCITCADVRIYPELSGHSKFVVWVEDDGSIGHDLFADHTMYAVWCKRNGFGPAIGWDD